MSPGFLWAVQVVRPHRILGGHRAVAGAQIHTVPHALVAVQVIVCPAWVVHGAGRFI